MYLGINYKCSVLVQVFRRHSQSPRRRAVLVASRLASRLRDAFRLASLADPKRGRLGASLVFSFCWLVLPFKERNNFIRVS